jgi:NAD(P)-dependent dehydrogenase (short-subunit alcohol dehydrogenase family)
MNEFQNKVAIVIGGTSGIGRAAAVAYAREGARVVVAGSERPKGKKPCGSSGLRGAKDSS